MNTGQTIDIQDGAQLRVNTSARLTGGTVQTSGSGFVNPFNGSIFEDVTSSATVVQSNGRTVIIQNGLTNHGTWNIQSSGSTTPLSFAGGSQTIGGTGQIVLTDGVNNRITIGGGDTLTNGADHTIRGAGRLLVNSGGMMILGTIVAEGLTR